MFDQRLQTQPKDTDNNDNDGASSCTEHLESPINSRVTAIYTFHSGAALWPCKVHLGALKLLTTWFSAKADPFDPLFLFLTVFDDERVAVKKVISRSFQMTMRTMEDTRGHMRIIVALLQLLVISIATEECARVRSANLIKDHFVIVSLVGYYVGSVSNACGSFQ